MKPSRLFLAVTTLALALLFTFAVPSALAGKKAAPPLDTRKLIKSVNAAAGTVEIETMRDKTSRTYRIDDMSSVTVNKGAGKIANIKAGMQVMDYVERDSQTLDSITVGKALPPGASNR